MMQWHRLDEKWLLGLDRRPARARLLLCRRIRGAAQEQQARRQQRSRFHSLPPGEIQTTVTLGSLVLRTVACWPALTSTETTFAGIAARCTTTTPSSGWAIRTPRTTAEAAAGTPNTSACARWHSRCDLSR